MGDSPTNALGAFANLRSFVGRGAKVSAPVTAFCGAMADLASTIAAFSFYLFIGFAVTTLVSGYMWLARYRREYARAAADGVLQPAELAALHERNGWSITFSFSIVATVVMGGFVLAAKLAGDGDKGVLATMVPALQKVQDSLFRVEKKIDAVKEDTAAIKTDTASVKQDTARIAASVEDIARRFDALNAAGGIIATPTTPEEHYHNARLHELGANFAAARDSYMGYLAADLETLDPWLNYSAMLKVQEGHDGAKETMRYFADKSKSVSFQVALALLEEREPRLAKLQALAREHPDYGPLPYLVSQEFSENKRGDTTLADQRAERAWLEQFRAAHAAGKFVKYFLDKREAQKWLDAAEGRWTKLNSTPAAVRENPVTLTAMQSNGGWAVTFILSDFKTKELFYKLDGQGDFQSTGHQPFNNPQTGLPQAKTYVPLPGLAEGEHLMEVRYLDKNDQMNGPYTLKFSTAAEQMAQGKNTLTLLAGSWLMFRDYNGKTLLYFTTLMGNRPVLKEVRYSLNNESLDHTFHFAPTDKAFEVGDEVSITVPSDTQFACVQVTFKDGTKSETKKFSRGQ